MEELRHIFLLICCILLIFLTLFGAGLYIFKLFWATVGPGLSLKIQDWI